MSGRCDYCGEVGIDMHCSLCACRDGINSENLTQELDQLQAENLQMREVLKTIALRVCVGTEFCPCCIAEEAIHLTHTAHLARKIELMEKAVEQIRKPSNRLDILAALKEFDEHEAKRPKS